MNRIILTILVSLISVSMSAQIYESKGFADVAPGVYVTAIDSLSTKEMPTVTITVIQNKDTLYAVTDNKGEAYIGKLAPDDSLTISASMLGYRTLSKKIPHNSVSYVLCLLSEDPLELNAIIVEDDAVLMVSKGDTTVYNPDSLKLPDGSDLEDLLKRLPGIEVQDGVVTSMGRGVSKILLNGTTFFGADISAALSLVMSDMVKNVKIYEQHDQDRIVESDTLGRKELVADVITKEKITVLQALSLLAEAGMFSQGQTMARAKGKFDAYELDKPTISAELTAGKNADAAGPVTIPSDYLQARLKFEAKKQFKFHVSNNLILSYDRKRTDAFNELLYSDLDRKEISSSSSSSRYFDFKNNANAMINVGGMNSFNPLLNLSYNDLKRSVIDNDSTVFNDRLYKSFMNRREGSRKFNLHLALPSMSRLKNGSMLGISAGIAFDAVHSDGNAVDTLPQSAVRQHLTDKASTWRLKPSINVTYETRLRGELRLKTSLAGSLLYSRERRNSMDRILDVLDPFNTFDYTNNSFKGELGLIFKFRNIQKGIHLEAGFKPKVLTQAVDEHSTGVGDNSRLWFLIDPDFRFIWSRQPFEMILNYSENEMLPTVNQLRSTIRYSNPLYLSAGNPGLKIPVARSMHMSVGMRSFETGSVCTLAASFTHTSDHIGNNTLYFDAPTTLKEYDFEAIAGSRLARPENIGAAWKMNVGLKSSFIINKIKSNVSADIGASASRTPFMTDGMKNVTGQDEISASIDYISSFSKVFGLEFRGRYSYGVNMLNSSEVYDYSTIILDARPSVTIASAVTLSAGYHLNSMITDRQGAGYVNECLAASISYRFGKDRRFALSLVGNDLLDDARTETISFTDLYMQTSRQSLLGRCVYLSFEIKIR